MVVSLAFGIVVSSVAALVFVPAPVAGPAPRRDRYPADGHESRRPGRQSTPRVVGMAGALPLPAGQPAQPRVHGPLDRGRRGAGPRDRPHCPHGLGPALLPARIRPAGDGRAVVRDRRKGALDQRTRRGDAQLGPAARVPAWGRTCCAARWNPGRPPRRSRTFSTPVWSRRWPPSGATSLLSTARYATGQLALVALDAHGRREFAIGGSLRILLLYDYAEGAASRPSTCRRGHTSLLQRFVRVFGELSPGAVLYKPSPPVARNSGRQCGVFPARFRGALPGCTVHRRSAHAWCMPAVVFAGGDLGGRFEAARQAILGHERQPDSLKEALSALRPQGGEGSWDVMGAPGGLTDIELLVEHLRLVASAASAFPVADGLAATLEAVCAARVDRCDGRRPNSPARHGCGRTSTVSCAWRPVDQDPTRLSPEEQFDTGRKRAAWPRSTNWLGRLRQPGNAAQRTSTRGFRRTSFAPRPMGRGAAARCGALP